MYLVVSELLAHVSSYFIIFENKSETWRSLKMLNKLLKQKKTVKKRRNESGWGAGGVGKHLDGLCPGRRWTWWRRVGVWLGGVLSMIWSWKAQLSGSFTPRVEPVNWSQVSSGLRCCSLFFRLSDPMSGRWRRWLLGGRGAKGLPVGYVKHTQSLSPCLGDYDQQSMSHTCTGQHNGNSAGQWRRRERPVIRVPPPMKWITLTPSVVVPPGA